MTPYQFGIKMAVAPQAASMMGAGGKPQPLTSGQMVEQHMRTINQPPKPLRVAPPKPQPPVMPNLNTSMLMGNNALPYSYSPAYNQSSNFMGVTSAPIDDIDVGPMDYAGKPSPSFMSSVPSTKQLMAKVPTAPRSPFNAATVQQPTAPAPAPTDVAKF